MANSKPSTSTSAPSLTRAAARELVRTAVERSRADPAAFGTFCFADPAGRPLRPAAVHHELQAFLTRHPRALVELPRDHGKSVQVCARRTRELARNPGLRVRVVCG